MSRSPTLLHRARAQLHRISGRLIPATGVRGWSESAGREPVVELLRPLGSRRTEVLHIAWSGDGGAELWEPLRPDELDQLREVVRAAEGGREASATVIHWDLARRRRSMVHMETAEGGIRVTLSLLHAGGRANRSIQVLSLEQLASLG